MNNHNNHLNNNQISTIKFAQLILDIGTFLLASGAHCGRIYTNISRLAQKWEFEVRIEPSFKGLLVSVRNLNQNEDYVTLYKESPKHNVHFQVLTAISLLTWQVAEGELSFDDTIKKVEKIKKIPHYNPWLISLAVGIACAGLCIFSLGDLYNAGIAFIAAFIGSVFRIEITKRNFNPMIAIIIAAFITTMITGMGSLLNIGANPQAAMATAVLYLIPGVPLINSVIDLIEGYLSSAVNRSLFAGFVLLCIAVGMTLSITIMGISNFN